ncbi:WIAG-tail domain, partial [Paenibacillus sp. S28]
IQPLHLQARSIQEWHLQSGAVHSDHIQNGAIQNRHIAARSVTGEQLAFAPVQSASGQPALQQYGITSFRIGEGQLQVEVPVTLPEPYPNTHYVIVAMCNHPDFYAVLNTQREDIAFIEVVRRRVGPETFGFLSWIAIGSVSPSGKGTTGYAQRSMRQRSAFRTEAEPKENKDKE